MRLPPVFQFSWKHFLPRLIFALLCAWVLSVLGLANLFAYILIHPTCPPFAAEQPGFEPVAIRNASGLMLHGWWHPPQNGRVILLVGGLGSSRDAMLPDARMLAGHGYGTLAVEPRACTGARSTLGYREAEDLQAMAVFALSQPGVQRLGGLGFSAGGASMLLAAPGMPEIEALVIQGNFANLYTEMTAAPTTPLSFKWQMQRLVAFFFGVWSGIPPSRISPIDALPHIRQPLLFIYGETEAKRTRAHSQYLAAGGEARLWIVPGAGHGNYRQVDPSGYERRIIDFFETSLGN